MRKSKIKLSLILLLITMVIIIGGCSNEINELTGKNNLEDQVTNDGDLPVKDSELAEHAPRQLIVKADNDRALNDKLQEIGARIESEIEDMNVKKIILPKNTSIIETARELKEVRGVKYANPNYKRKQMTSFTGDKPDDPQYDKLWGLEAINAPEAWKTTTGSSDVVIAVIDTGVQKDHPDLENKVLDGFNVFEENSNTEDEDGHGTHVAGIAAGFGNNNKGIAGVAWESPVLPIRVFQSGESSYSFEFAEGINWLSEWAQENDNKRIVANMSLGGPAVCKAEKEALDRAIEQGIVFSVAMGNEYQKTVNYPAAYNGVIAVGSTNGNNKKSDFSTTGDWISVAAPGSGILSSVPEDEWDVYSGTSMATPYVSGAAALVLAENPDYSPAEVKSVLENTAQDLGQTGFDQKFGHGLIDVVAALAGTPDDNAKYSVKVIAEVDEDEDGELEEVEMKGADVTLKSSNRFVEDEVTDNSGVAVFNMIDPGMYDVEVIYSKRRSYQEQPPSYEYATKTIKNQDLVTGENSSTVKLEGGMVNQINIFSTIADQEYFFSNDEVKVEVLDDNDELVFTDIEIESLLQLNPGDYILRVSNYEDDNYPLDFTEEKPFTIKNNEETLIEVSAIPFGKFSIDLTFENEEGDTVSPDNLEYTLLDGEGEKVYKREIIEKPVEEVIEDQASPGEYTLKITAVVKDPDWAKSDKVGYKEFTVNVEEGEISEENVTMTVK